ncbi:hypothetical protein NDU88_005413 [Pleurodeles waltl]|uniref:Uncharacterized protein n=1 Tax=Pleurodeles waltl TaxID=8319 RepID=A0AAV7PIG8_PLEWA|nr:hypothetical protein NDU88_005413 [Pleurodeles waltl]
MLPAPPFPPRHQLPGFLAGSTSARYLPLASLQGCRAEAATILEALAMAGAFCFPLFRARNGTLFPELSPPGGILALICQMGSLWRAVRPPDVLGEVRFPRALKFCASLH